MEDVSTYRDEQWQLLLAFLRRHGEVEVAPSGRLQFTPTASDRRIEIVMTPDEWEDTVSVGWGELEGPARHLLETAERASADQSFLVYDGHHVEPSALPEIVPTDDASVEELRQSSPLPSESGWYVASSDGRWHRYPDEPDET